MPRVINSLGGKIQAGSPIAIPEGATPAALAGHGIFYMDVYGRPAFRSPTENLIFTDVPGTHSVEYTIPLRGVTDSIVNLRGELREVTAGETGNYATDFAVSNQHIYIHINTIDVGGDIVISGTSVNAITGVPTLADTKTITVDTTADQYYQDTTHWWEVTNVDVSDLTNVDYDIGVVRGAEINTSDFRIIGYSLDAFSQGINPDLALQIIKVQNDGDDKMSLVDIEYIGVDANGAGNQIVDHVRTGADDRSLNPAVAAIWADNTTLSWNQDDLDDYFSNDENIFEMDKHEGYIIRYKGEPAGAISNVDWAVLQLRYVII